MTRSLRSTGITPLHHYKETDSPPQLDDEAAMTYERFICCGSAKPVANYYDRRAHQCPQQRQTRSSSGRFFHVLLTRGAFKFRFVQNIP
jgi:hypothetical protein